MKFASAGCVAAACLSLFTVAATRAQQLDPGQLIMWNQNNYGQCNAPDVLFRDINCHTFYALGIDVNGDLRRWGTGEPGGPALPPEFTAGPFLQVRGRMTTIALRADGEVAIWPLDAQGTNCGLGAPPPGPFVQVGAGGWHAAALRADGSIVVWGCHSSPWNGHDVSAAPEGGPFVQIACGDWNTHAIRMDGTIGSAGYGTDGANGSPPGNSFIKVAGGWGHGLALRSDGSVVGWGRNYDGEVNVPPGTYTDIAAGGAASMGLRADGTVVVWGRCAHDASGQNWSCCNPPTADGANQIEIAGAQAAIIVGPALSEGLEAHYKFDGDSLDSSGNGRDGVPTALSYTDGPVGALGQAASFDGLTTDVRADGIPIPTDNRFSWAWWMRCEEIGHLCVVQRMDAPLLQMTPSLFIRVDGALGFGTYSFVSGGSSVETAAATVAIGSWMHVACTSDGSGIRRVYINGALVGEGTAPDYGQPCPTLQVGRDRDSFGPRYRGALDDLRIYNRPLTAAEVLSLYQVVGQQDGDGDGVPDAWDECPQQPGAIECDGCPTNECGLCGANGTTDFDGDQLIDCLDPDDDNDGVEDGQDAFPLDATESVDTDGDGVGNNADQDDDGDGTDDASDGCPLDPNKLAPGLCGCGVPDTDTDGDGVPDCIDNCDVVVNPAQHDCDSDGIGDGCEPAPSVTLTAKLWGAAGGPNRCCDGWHCGGSISCGATGVAGGYVNATLEGIAPGTVLYIYVGQGGQFNGLTDTFGGGGHAGCTGGGSGGGASYISLIAGPTEAQADMLLAVAGGGAGGPVGPSDVVGNGGGEVGATGSQSGAGGVAGTGGTQSAGGTSATGGYGGGGAAGSDGQFLQGGFGMGCAGGGGGGGYYGGGGGHGDCGHCAAGIGGGGSSFINSAFATSIHNNDQGIGQSVHPNASSDPDWANNAGNGTNGPGGSGRVVLVIDDVRYTFDYTGVVQTFVVPAVAADCNNNGVADSCDIASGVAQDCNANGKPDSCDIATGGGRPYPGAVQWRVADGGNGHWYKRFENSVLWAEAQDICVGLGGHLATVPTASENAFVAAVNGDQHRWLGGFQAANSCENDCEWQWVTGEPWNWANWEPGQPDNANEEDRLQFWVVGDRWNDHRGDTGYGFICEWESGPSADCNSNGVPDSCEIASGAAQDCNSNGVPDSCEVDSDGDGTIDVCDGCPSDPAKIAPGACGCGVADTDTDGDSTVDCFDDDDDNDGVVDWADAFPLDATESVDTDGDGIGDNADQDDDNDGADDASDGCPLDPNKVAPGQCGCGVADTDTDGDGVADCVDNCLFAVNPLQADCDNDGEGDACELGGTPPAGALQWTAASGGNDHWYLVSWVLYPSWTAAREAAESIGAHLVTFTSAAENQFVVDAGASLHVPWAIGLFQPSGSPEPAGGWRWVTGEPLEYANWISHQPDNGGGVEHVAHIGWWGNAEWNDWEEGGAYYAIMEWDSTTSDCNSNGIPDSCDIASGSAGDCNGDGILNSCEIAAGAPDCDGNGVPDACDLSSGGSANDCNGNGVLDSCDLASGAAADCNSNSVPDSCDIASGTSADVDANGVPDECKSDCNDNGLPDAWEVQTGQAADCNADLIPDECQWDWHTATTGNMGDFGYGLNVSGVLAGCVESTTEAVIIIEAVGDLGANTEYLAVSIGGLSLGNYIFGVGGNDCPAEPNQAVLSIAAAEWNALVDAAGIGGEIPVLVTPSPLVAAGQCAAPLCELRVEYGGQWYDCNGNGAPDICDIAGGAAPDCNGNLLIDGCEITDGLVPDLDADGVPDDCQTDCNSNGLPDTWETATGQAPDCNANSVPDSCDLASGAAPDCNGNQLIDSCELATGQAPDCNANSVPDSCDISSGTSADVDSNGVPDTCQVDCNNNTLPDTWELATGQTPDCNQNAVPDSCDIASGFSADVDTNGVPDECKADCNDNGLPDAWEIATGMVPDCNINAVPDSCDLDSGVALDCNMNNVPDSCDIAAGDIDKDGDGVPDSCELAYGDFDLDNQVGAADLTVLLAIWGWPDPPFGDLNGDGAITAYDLGVLLSRWGPVP